MLTHAASFSPWFLGSYVFFLGLIIGSFLNVVIVRLPHGQSILRPRSRCVGCQQPIAWYDNFPLLSWVLLRGRCRRCRAPISARYPLIELMTGMLFLAAYVHFGFSPVLFVRELPFFAAMVAITFIDLEHRIIPDELSLGGLAWGLLTTCAFAWLTPDFSTQVGMIGWQSSLIGAGLGFSLFFGLSWGYLYFTGRSGLGGGDVKLLAMIGAFLGTGGVFATILISSISGSIIGIGWALYSRRQSVEDGAEPESLMMASIPYGPFLVIGALYYHLLGDTLWFQFTIPT